MPGVNEVTIIGRLGKDPELKYSPSGSAVCILSVATSENRTDKSTGEVIEETEWHRIVFFNKAAEVIAKHAKKGERFYTRGALKTRSWMKNDEKRYSTEIIGDRFEFLGCGRNEASEPAGQQSDPGAGSPPIEAYDDDTPF